MLTPHDLISEWRARHQEHAFILVKHVAWQDVSLENEWKWINSHYLDKEQLMTCSFLTSAINCMQHKLNIVECFYKMSSLGPSHFQVTTSMLWYKHISRSDFCQLGQSEELYSNEDFWKKKIFSLFSSRCKLIF